jgi:L-alanine-DL-glutamate epimerase-like enolase superfamily enzyme
MNRRSFLRTSIAALAVGIGSAWSPAPPPITRILIQSANGKRLTPVAPNAYAPYRGYNVTERIVRIQTSNGLEGIGPATAKPEVLKTLLGLRAPLLFQWKGGQITGVSERYQDTVFQLFGADVALLDLIGKLYKQPIADLLGKRKRQQVRVYDSSLYMEDLLKPAELDGLAYLNDSSAKDAIERVARKALWVVRQPEGINILKIKIGRAKWMDSFDSALERDIAVVKAVHRAVGPDITLFVDGNDGYKSRPLAAADFAEAVADAKVYAMEEMFPEDKIDDLREVKRRMRAAGIATKLADGENHRDGIPLKICAEMFRGRKRDEPLFDIEQADMNANGYLRMQAIARERARFRMTVAPHNFGSKLGFWSQVHLGLVTPNWEFCETDDSQFPALRPEGIQIKKGLASLTGAHGLGVRLDETRLEPPSLVLE